jgi:hypothetical protein
VGEFFSNDAQIRGVVDLPKPVVRGKKRLHVDHLEEGRAGMGFVRASQTNLGDVQSSLVIETTDQ